MARTASSPAWLRGILARGLSEDRDQRFPSMAELLAAMTRAQTRVRRRTAALGVGVAVALLMAGAWRLGAVRNVACAVPRDQLAAVWQSGDEATHPRRQALHRAFIASGLPAAEAAWRRVAGALDEYTAQWSAMYVGACEATHVRGDQTAEVLGLRMDCLNETLDGVRALTEVLSRADATMVGQAATAARNLTPVKHCADVPALRSAVPVPHDDATAGAVAEVRRTLRDAYALFEVGNERAALARARAILPRAEVTQYKPVVAEVLHQIAYMQSDGAPAEAEQTFEEALDEAEAARDDLTAAKAAIGLVFVTAIAKEQRHENEQWRKLAHAIVDRLPPPQHRLRGWLLNNEAAAFLQQRRFEEARRLLEQSVALKEEELGKNHPDIVRTNIGLIWALNELGRPAEGLRIADQCLAVLGPLDADSVLLAYTLNNRGDALSALRRYAEAERDYQTSLRIMRAQFGETSSVTAVPIVGIGNARLGQGDVAGAVRELEHALALQQGSTPDPTAVADTRFALARALVASGRERARARGLAGAAERAYASEGIDGKQREVAAWLAAH
ncbi:MAG TPA: tetratricopeptide repeat protein, partial [Polyangia bacterium]